MRVIAWLFRHPLFTVLPTVLIVAWSHLGLIVTAVLVGGASLGLLIWCRAHPATFDAIAAPKLRAGWRRWWAYRGKRWAARLKDCELTRENPTTGITEVPRVVKVTAPTPSIDTIRVRMVRGQDETVWVDQARKLAHAYEVERVAVSKYRPGRVQLTVERRNPFASPIPAPLIPQTRDEVDLCALEIGDDEFGCITTVPLLGGASHVLGAGATDSGKSGLMWCPMRAAGPMIRDRWVRPWMIDMKGGMETSAAKPLFEGRWADNGKDAVELLHAFIENMQRKQKKVAQTKERRLTIGPDNPLDWMIIDEAAMLTAYGDRETIAKALKALGIGMTQGRATLDAVWAFLQEPLKDILPIRDLFITRICLAVASASHVNGILGAGMWERGAIADEIPIDPEYTGIGFRVDKKQRQVRRIRVGHCKDTDIEELVRTCTPTTQSGLHIVKGVA